MDRRKALKVAAGVFAGGGIGMLALSQAFKTDEQTFEEPIQLDYDPPENDWKYDLLTPAVSARLAYTYYSEGSCMYATVRSVISQLAEKTGEPYSSFPYHMFKYGHGGIGGYGSVCGALNGAAALIGLLISEKGIQDRLIADIFQWYEKESFPTFSPANPVFDVTPARSLPNSILCHASNTKWSNDTGFHVSSNERKERCRRLTADVAQKVTTVLNEIHADNYVANLYSEETVNTCVACHGKEGKVKNVSTRMSCNSCHSESMGHKIFSDVHYRFMKE
ncbi:MAG: C-GCAxxG-C-C family protein [Bacteroidales bacterium]